jgi:hypothetical protein
MGKSEVNRKTAKTVRVLPSQLQRRSRFATLALSAVLGLSAPSLYASAAMASCSISGTMQLQTSGVLEDCTVAEGGTYNITGYGGAGGSMIDAGGLFYYGSSGGEITAQFSLMAGQSFFIVTGNAGKNGLASSSGGIAGSGGQGTFFALDSGGTLTPYLVAGGGGGDGESGGYLDGYGGGGQVVTDPASLTGSGGSGTSLSGGGGGGGFLTNSDLYTTDSGLSFVGQAVGSSYAGTGGTGGNTDFSNYNGPGGGGGGYDGGNAGNNSGSGGMGGTNYYNPSLATNVNQAAGASDVASPAVGQLDFTLVSASTSTTSSDPTSTTSTSVPEPPALSLFALSVASVFLLSRRKARQALRFAPVLAR